jgi:ubiquinol-cytochrome c reductase cytochrome b subunit
VNLAVVGARVVMFLLFPVVLADPENYLQANPLSSPLHIKPEWYFLAAYALLRAVPNKLGGVVRLGMRVMIFYLLPFKHRGKVRALARVTLFSWVGVALLLTFLGAIPVEVPFIVLSQVYCGLYFLLLVTV